MRPVPQTAIVPEEPGADDAPGPPRVRCGEERRPKVGKPNPHRLTVNVKTRTES